MSAFGPNTSHSVDAIVNDACGSRVCENSTVGIFADEKVIKRRAGAGGVTVSYFEWVQNNANERWELDEIHRQLRGRMYRAADAVLDRWELLRAELASASGDREGMISSRGVPRHLSWLSNGSHALPCNGVSGHDWSSTWAELRYYRSSCRTALCADPDLLTHLIPWLDSSLIIVGPSKPAMSTSTPSLAIILATS